MRGDLFTSGSDISFRKLVKGAAAGFIATAPMSASMLIGWTLLPRREKYPLPPRLITEEITEQIGIEDQLTEDQLVGLTIFSHFAYGALFGSIYALSEGRIPIHASLKGAFTGLVIWAGSYLGWLPTGILRPATRHPWRRNLLMSLAHCMGCDAGRSVTEAKRI
jgi:putative membrane protein